MSQEQLVWGGEVCLEPAEPEGNRRPRADQRLCPVRGEREVERARICIDNTGVKCIIIVRPGRSITAPQRVGRVPAFSPKPTRCIMEWISLITTIVRFVVDLWKKAQGQKQVGDTYVFVNAQVAQRDPKKQFPLTPLAFGNIETDAYWQTPAGTVFKVTRVAEVTVHDPEGDRVDLGYQIRGCGRDQYLIRGPISLLELTDETGKPLFTVEEVEVEFGVPPHDLNGGR